MEIDPNKVWPTGLTLAESEELHRHVIEGTRIFGFIAALATCWRTSTHPGFTKGIRL